VLALLKAGTLNLKHAIERDGGLLFVTAQELDDEIR